MERASARARMSAPFQIACRRRRRCCCNDIHPKITTRGYRRSRRGRRWGPRVCHLTRPHSTHRVMAHAMPDLHSRGVRQTYPAQTNPCQCQPASPKTISSTPVNCTASLTSHARAAVSAGTRGIRMPTDRRRRNTTGSKQDSIYGRGCSCRRCRMSRATKLQRK